MATFGKTAIGALISNEGAGYKWVCKFTLPEAGSVTKLTMYARGNDVVGGQKRKGVIYAHTAGQPGALLGVTNEVTIAQNQAAAWVDLPFASPLDLAAADYWLGVILDVVNVGSSRYYDTGVSGDQKYNTDSPEDGPSDPFGTPVNDVELDSIYATYTSSATATVAWLTA